MGYVVDEMQVHNPVKQTAEVVSATSAFVTINKNRISHFCGTLDPDDLQQPWLTAAPVDLSTLESNARLNFVLLISSLSFRYWGKPKWTVEYQGRNFDGAWGLVVALWKALEGGSLKLDPKSWSDFDERRARKILTGNVLIPRFDTRLKILRQLGHVLGQEYKGSFRYLLESVQSDAVRLVLFLANELPSFADVSRLNGRTIFFYKRAQLLVADIVRTCSEIVPDDVHDISHLSACADYKLPWLLRKLQILAYTKALSERIDRGMEIPPNSREEIEIRANTVWAVELITRTLRTKVPKVTAIQVNDYLWLRAQEKSPDDPPYHLTDTIFY